MEPGDWQTCMVQALKNSETTSPLRGRAKHAGFNQEFAQGENCIKTTDRNSLVTFPILVLIGALVGLAGSQGGASDLTPEN